jgi:hypothetical protein
MSQEYLRLATWPSYNERPLCSRDTPRKHGNHGNWVWRHSHTKVCIYHGYDCRNHGNKAESWEATRFPILNHQHSLYTPDFLKIHFNIFNAPTPWPSMWFLPTDFCTKTLYATLWPPHRCHTPSPSNYSWFYKKNNIWRGMQMFSCAIHTEI